MRVNGQKQMNKNNCYRIKYFLEDSFKEKPKPILLEIKIIDKYAKGLWFWRMRIKVAKEYKHLLNHIYQAGYSMCALNGEYLDKKKIRGSFLYLS